MRSAIVAGCVVIFLMLSCLWATFSPAQTPASNPASMPASQPTTAPAERLLMIQKDGKVGFINAAGKIVIEPKFTRQAKPPSSIDDFHDGMARVMVDLKKWGYIDRTGKMVIEPQYEFADRFAEGLAPVIVKGQTGYINKKGEMVISPQFDRAWPFSEGLAMYTVYDKGQGMKHKYGFIDTKGNIVIEPMEMDGPGYYFHDGMLVFLKDQKYGYMDEKGHIAIEPQFKVGTEFSEGLAMAGKENGKVGFIDKSGSWVIGPEFKAAGEFSEGLASFSKGVWKWGFIDTKGNVVIEPKWVSVGRFKNGLASVRLDPPENTFKENGNVISMEMKSPPKFGYIDKTGNMAIGPEFDEAGDFDDGIAKVTIRELIPPAEGKPADPATAAYSTKIGYIDTKGKYIWKPTE